MVLLAGSAQASLLFSVRQVGPDVVTSVSGSVKLEGGYWGPQYPTLAAINPANGFISVGPDRITDARRWSTIASGSDRFISGGFNYILASSGSGDAIAFRKPGAALYLDLPIGYVSGRAISSTSTYANHTLDDLGFIKGTYTWNWGSGSNADSLTLTVVPEPHQYAMAAGLGLVGIGLWRRHARK